MFHTRYDTDFHAKVPSFQPCDYPRALRAYLTLGLIESFGNLNRPSINWWNMKMIVNRRVHRDRRLFYTKVGRASHLIDPLEPFNCPLSYRNYMIFFSLHPLNTSKSTTPMIHFSYLNLTVTTADRARRVARSLGLCDHRWMKVWVVQSVHHQGR